MESSLSHLPVTGRTLLKAFVTHGGIVRRADYPRPTGTTAAWRLTPPGALKARTVIAHATGNDAFYPHASLINLLLNLGHEVFVFDLDGHGVSSNTRLVPETTRGMVAAALTAARRDDATLPTHLIGQSLSAAIALHDVARGAEITRLVGISTPSEIVLTPKAAGAELAMLMQSSFWQLRRDYGWSRLMPAFGPFRRDAYPVRLTNMQRAAFRYPAVVARIVESLAVLEHAERIAVPTLFVHGSRDKIVPMTQGQALAARTPGSRLVVADGATHFTTPLVASSLAAIGSFLGGDV